MKIAAGIVTDRGGRTSHAAIVARELGIPAIVGATGARRRRSRRRRDGDASRAPRARRGASTPATVPFTCEEIDPADARAAAARRSCSTSATPSRRSSCRSCRATASGSRAWSSSSRAGSACIRSRSRATRRCPSDVQREVDALTARLRRQDRVLRRSPLARDRDASRPRSSRGPVILRFSDFKTNEYARLARRRVVRADRGEPDARLARREPLLPSRTTRKASCSRCAAVKRVREEFGLDEPEGHDPVLPHARGGRAGPRDDARRRARPRRERASRST